MSRSIQKRWRDEPRSGFKWFIVEDGLPYFGCKTKTEVTQYFHDVARYVDLRERFSFHEKYYIRIDPRSPGAA